MNVHNRVGAHLRLIESYESIALEARDLGVKHFQLFLVPQRSKSYLLPTPEDAAKFKKLSKLFDQIYIHSSYWINLASGNPHVLKKSRELIERELNAAHDLGINNLIIHPGSAKKHRVAGGIEAQRLAGLKTLCESIEWFLQLNTPVKLILENNAHGGTTLCSNLEDFAVIRATISAPKKIGYCLDTAHAYVYGYNLRETDEFLALVDTAIGIENISLIHLNDTHESFGSKQDSHAAPGEGNISLPVLKKLATHEKLNGKPIIVELPSDEHDKVEDVVHDVSRWF